MHHYVQSGRTDRPSEKRRGDQTSVVSNCYADGCRLTSAVMACSRL